MEQVVERTEDIRDALQKRRNLDVGKRNLDVEHRRPHHPRDDGPEIRQESRDLIHAHRRKAFDRVLQRVRKVGIETRVAQIDVEAKARVLEEFLQPIRDRGVGGEAHGSERRGQAERDPESIAGFDRILGSGREEIERAGQIDLRQRIFGIVGHRFEIRRADLLDHRGDAEGRPGAKPGHAISEDVVDTKIGALVKADIHPEGGGFDAVELHREHPEDQRIGIGGHIQYTAELGQGIEGELVDMQAETLDHVTCAGVHIALKLERECRGGTVEIEIDPLRIGPHGPVQKGVEVEGNTGQRDIHVHAACIVHVLFERHDGIATDGDIGQVDRETAPK